MSEKKFVGKRSVLYTKPPVIIGAGCVAGEKEGKGSFGKYYDMIEDDPLFGGQTWEEAESRMQQIATQIALRKAGMEPEDIRYLVAGDLLGQLIATSFGIMNFNIPMFGVYGACSTMGESLAIASMLVDGGFADYTIALTSSHFASAERQFRYPLAYGCQRPYSSTWTVTGSGAVILASREASWKHTELTYGVISGITTGTVARARKVQRFLSQPFSVAEQFTGYEGKYVPLKETIRGFREIIEGKHDEIPESYFLYVGSIDEVVAKFKGGEGK